MIQEQFPDLAVLRTPWALLRNQGNVQSCTVQGPINTIDTIFHRAGKNVNLSTRFPWYNLRGQAKSVEATAKSLRENGTCLESLCPYDVALLDTPPSPQAWSDAKFHGLFNVQPIRISGVDSLKRAICQGSAVTFCMVNGDGSEHVSCIDGYGRDGVYVWDSIGSALVMPWADVTSGRITQMYRWGGLPLTPVPDYIEGDVPTLINGVLSLPKLLLWIGWNSNPKSINAQNAKFNILDRGKITSGNDDVQDIVFWHSNERTLYLPKLIVDSTILHNVKMVNPIATLISGEEV